MNRIGSWVAALAMSLLAAGVAWAAVAVPAPVGEQGVALHVINVDQGSAALFETPCGTLLIDAGGRTKADTTHLLDYLKVYFAARPSLKGRFAAVYLSHPHYDHAKSMIEVDKVYEFGVFVDDGRRNGEIPNKLAEIYTGNKVRHVNEVTFTRLTPAQRKEGYTDKGIDPLVCEGPIKPKVTALSGGRAYQAGWTKEENDNDNNHSLVLRIEYGATAFLFMGDLEDDGQRDLVTRYGDTDLLDIDVLLVAHHGADNGASDDLLKLTTPAIALISSGDPYAPKGKTAPGYGHPDKDALGRLVAVTSETRPSIVALAFNGKNSLPTDYPLAKAIYITAHDGDIVVQADGAGAIVVTTEK